MNGEKLKRLITQWVVPSVMLVLLLVGLLYQFWQQNKKVIDTFVESGIEQTGGTYGRNISAALESMVRVSNTVDGMLESRGDGNVYFLTESLNAIQESGAEYSVVYCYPNGEAITPGYEKLDIGDTGYFQEINTMESFFAYEADEKITGEDAILYICPIERREELAGYVIAYLNPEVLAEIFKDGNSYGDEVFYAIVDMDGNIIASYGGVKETQLLTDDFWNQLKVGVQAGSSWTIFDRQRTNREHGMIEIVKNGEARLLYQYPIENTEWSLVMGLNRDYAQQMLDRIWKPIVRLFVGIAICLICYITVIVIINVMSRIKTSEQKRALENKADTDQLTELLNKIATERMIREYIELHPNKQGVLFVIDVDNFKKVNDTLGHAFGDEVLRSLGMRLQSMFRVTDIIGRIGGDEFIVFLKDVRDDVSIESEGRKLEQFFRQFEVGQYVKYSVTASVGGAVFPRDADSFEDLYKAADAAVYISKKRGKNQLSFYHDDRE